jgi:hypothetical protein
MYLSSASKGGDSWCRKFDRILQAQLPKCQVKLCKVPTAGARGPEFNSGNAPNLEGFLFFIHGPSKLMLSPESQTFNQSDFVV